MSQRQNTTKGKSVPKKTDNRQNNSFNASSRSGQKQGNARNQNQGVSAQNLGGFGGMRAAPVAMSKVVKSRPPQMVTLRNGDCRIVHREYIQDIVGAATGANFNNTQLSINPGLAGTFAWLSKIAQNFESYKFNKLRFDYETEAPSSLGGTLVLAVDYDAADVAPLTKQQMLAYRGSVRSAPWTPCQHSSMKEDLEKLKSHFVRPGSVPANSEIRLWDVGTLNVATQGITSNSATCGELYVEYDVLLMTPLYESIPASSTITMTASTTAAPLTGGVSAGNLISSFTAAGVVNFQNLVVGVEYLALFASTGANAGTMSMGTLVGLTQKSLFMNDSVTSGFSFTATASSGSLTVVSAAANQGVAMFSFAQIPVSVL